jgi:hypothetical protein
MELEQRCPQLLTEYIRAAAHQQGDCDAVNAGINFVRELF